MKYLNRSMKLRKLEKLNRVVTSSLLIRIPPYLKPHCRLATDLGVVYYAHHDSTDHYQV